MHWSTNVFAAGGLLLLTYLVIAFFSARKVRMEHEVPLSLLRSNEAKVMGWNYEETDQMTVSYVFSGHTNAGYPWTLSHQNDAMSSVPQSKVVWEAEGLANEGTTFEISNGRTVEMMRSAAGQ